MDLFNVLDKSGNILFFENKYTRWYQLIVSNARSRFDTNCMLDYGEYHHIIPKCFFKKIRNKNNTRGWLDGNPNHRDNLVLLKAREHFICHWLLTKMVHGCNKHLMERAMSGLLLFNNKHRRIWTTCQYERLKRANSLAQRERMIGFKPSSDSNLKRRLALLGKSRSTDVCLKISESKKGRPSTLKNVPRTESTRSKISQSKIGHVVSESY